MSFEPGQTIGIPCDAVDGAFPNERLVSFETKTGPVSGFVQSDKIKDIGGQKYILGVVKEISQDTVTVWVIGSFFTTTGLAYLSPDARLRQLAA